MGLKPGEAGTQEGDRQLTSFRLFFFYLPESSMLRRFRFQLVVVSRFLSEIGQEGVFYGSLVTVAADGSAAQASLIGIAKVLPGATLGLVGGAVADALPRRVALGVGYILQAVFCVVLPIVFGTGFGVLLIRRYMYLRLRDSVRWWRSRSRRR
jgi:hypothetical protein